MTRFACFALLALMVGVSGEVVHAAGRAEIKHMVVEEARNSIVPPALALAVAKVESDFQARVESPKGARGVMQIMPATARDLYGVDADELWDARLNIQLGIDYLERLHGQYGGRWDLALSHYNGGIIGVTSLAVAEPHVYTRDYVDTVLRWRDRYQEQAALWDGTTLASADGWQPARTAVAPVVTPKPVGMVIRELFEPVRIVRRPPLDASFADRLAWAKRNLDDFAGNVTRIY